MKRLSSSTTSLFLTLLASPVAMAQPEQFRPGGGGEPGALTTGFLHPLAGWDYVLLALAAGWLAASLVKGSRAIGAAAFLLTLLAGAVASPLSPAVPPLQLALAAIVLAAGAMVLIGKSAAAEAGSASLQRSWFAALLALGGFGHGLVHGAQAPAGVAGALYAAGFAIGTALLLGGGVALKVAMARTGPWISRVAGAALVAAGSFFLIQAF